MENRITDFTISNKIEKWGTAILVIAIISIIIGVIASISAAMLSSGSEVSSGVLVAIAGILLIPASYLMKGFAVLVRKSLNELVEDGDDKYLDHIEKREEPTEE